MLASVNPSILRSCCRHACCDLGSHRSTNSRVEGTEARLRGCLSVLVAILQDGADDSTAAFLKQQLRLLIKNSSGQHGMYGLNFVVEERLRTKHELNQRNRVGRLCKYLDRVFCSEKTTGTASVRSPRRLCLIPGLAWLHTDLSFSCLLPYSRASFHPICSACAGRGGQHFRDRDGNRPQQWQGPVVGANRATFPLGSVHRSAPIDM